MTDLSMTLREALEREATGASTVALAGAVERLSSRYRSVHPADTPILATPVDVLAYATYRMPATYGAVRLALEHGLRAGLGEMRSIVDLGGGTGAAVWAAAETWPDLGSATVLEQVPQALELGRSLVAGGGLPATTWQRWRLGDPAPEADLVTVSYVLSELNPSQQSAVVGRATASAQKAVLIVEPGTPDGHRRVLAARDALISASWRILAPCPHQLTCPLVDNDWCHFAARVNRSALHRKIKGGELSHEDEKFSYILAVPTDSTGLDTPSASAPGYSTGGGGEPDPSPVESASPQGEPYRDQPQAHENPARVIRHPLKRKGLVELQLCRPDGRAGREVVSKKQGARYKDARDLDWGDAWRV